MGSVIINIGKRIKLFVLFNFATKIINNYSHIKVTKINGDFIFLVLFYERSMNQNFKTHFLVSSMGMNLLLTLKIKTKVIKLSIKSKNDSNKNEIFDEN
jgi:hypothetical protein